MASYKFKVKDLALQVTGSELIVGCGASMEKADCGQHTADRLGLDLDNSTSSGKKQIKALKLAMLQALEDLENLP